MNSPENSDPSETIYSADNSQPIDLAQEEVEDKPSKTRKEKISLTLSFGSMIAVIFAVIMGSTGGALLGVFALDSAAKRFANSGEIVVNSPETASWAAAAASVASPSTVAIIASSRANVTTGSGIMFDDEGHIVTSAHVINHLGVQLDNIQIQVKTWDGDIYPASIVGLDETTDIGVVRVDPEFDAIMKPAKWGDSSAVNTGDSVVALGAPFDLLNTVTSGIISNPDRVIQLTSQSAGEKASDNIQFLGEEIPVENSVTVRVIQSDVAINPGNSGGPLINADGEVIGLVAAIAGGEYSTGLAFSIKSNTVQRVAQDIVDTGSAQNSLLGVIVTSAYPEWASESGASFQSGALVEDISPGSAADNAGLQKGDIVTYAGKTRISTSVGLSAFVRDQAPGSEIELTILREGTSLTLTAVLQEQP